jgi:hypothetical protein
VSTATAPRCLAGEAVEGDDDEDPGERGSAGLVAGMGALRLSSRAKGEYSCAILSLGRRALLAQVEIWTNPEFSRAALQVIFLHAQRQV